MEKKRGKFKTKSFNFGVTIVTRIECDRAIGMHPVLEDQKYISDTDKLWTLKTYMGKLEELVKPN